VAEQASRAGVGLKNNLVNRWKAQAGLNSEARTATTKQKEQLI
jgi:hypothetical protein